MNVDYIDLMYHWLLLDLIEVLYYIAALLSTDYTCSVLYGNNTDGEVSIV